MLAALTTMIGCSHAKITFVRHASGVCSGFFVYEWQRIAQCMSRSGGRVQNAWQQSNEWVVAHPDSQKLARLGWVFSHPFQDGLKFFMHW